MARFVSTNATPLLNASDSDDNEELNTESLNEPTCSNDSRPLFKPPEPKDKYSMAFFIFYFIGMTTLLPWNFFVTADDYWMYKLRDVNRSSLGVVKRNKLQAEFTSYIGIASSIPTIIFLIVNTFVIKLISLNKRMLGSLIAMLILFIVTTVFVNVNTDDWQQRFFILTLFIIAFLNISSAILSGSLFSIIGKFRPKYITAVVGGQALGGIFAAVVQIISLSIGASSVHTAFVYFMIGNITVAICIVSYIILSKTIFFRYHLHEKSLIPNEFQNILVRHQIICYKSLLKKIWLYGATLCSVFAISMAVYPGVTVLIESEGRGKGNPWNDTYFVPTINYLLFNVGDYFGRLAAGKILKPKKGSVQFALSLARIVFVPLLMLCNAQPRHNLPVIFHKDYMYVILLALFALSNGYLANISTICAPRVVEQHEKEIASSIVMVFLGLGLGIGCGFSLLMVNLL